MAGEVASLASSDPRSLPAAGPDTSHHELKIREETQKSPPEKLDNTNPSIHKDDATGTLASQDKIIADDRDAKARIAKTEPDPIAATVEVEADATRSWWFWLIFVSLCLISFICGLDASITVTALPSIVGELGGEGEYVWIANSFMMAGTALLPLWAQSANVFGRRNPMLLGLVFFAIGSGVAGGANSVAAVIAGRTLQGLGAGGVYVLLDVILCDIVPLRSRTKYLGLMNGGAAVGTLAGPPIGGALAQRNWRWVFYINLPIAGVAIISVIFFLRLK